jgi:hypothetical protein
MRKFPSVMFGCRNCRDKWITSAGNLPVWWGYHSAPWASVIHTQVYLNLEIRQSRTITLKSSMRGRFDFFNWRGRAGAWISVNRPSSSSYIVQCVLIYRVWPFRTTNVWMYCVFFTVPSANRIQNFNFAVGFECQFSLSRSMQQCVRNICNIEMPADEICSTRLHSGERRCDLAWNNHDMVSMVKGWITINCSWMDFTLQGLGFFKNLWQFLSFVQLNIKFVWLTVRLAFLFSIYFVDHMLDHFWFPVIFFFFWKNKSCWIC